jgi:hypothetical protein
MARIPVYERRIAQESNAPIARVGASPVAAALQNLGQAGMQAVDRVMAADQMAAERAKREAEEVDKAQVPNLLSNGQVYWQQREDERRQAWKVGDPDMREKVGQEFDKWVAESSKALNTDDGRRYFQQHAASMRARLLTDTYSYQRRSTVEKLNADNAVGEANDEILVARAWNNPAEVNAIIARRIEPLLARTDLSEAEKIVAAEKVKARMFLARERAFVENDPQGWLLANGGLPKPGAATPAPGFDAVVQQILKTEGGYNATDGNSGAPVNFGINQRANPDIDVKNLTREGAIKIYRDRYWNAIGADNLSGPLQATAMDAAVNQGVGWTKGALAEAGGDVLKFNELRRARYREIAKNPDQAKFLNTWLARVKDPVAGPGDQAPAAAAGAPAAPTGWASQHLDPDKLYQLRGLAESRVAQVQTQVRSEAERTVGDALAMHKDGKVDPFNLTPDYFDRAFGADGPRRFTEYKAGQGMAQAIGNFASQSPEQIAAAIQTAAPAQGPGYAMADARQQVMVQAARQVIEERAKDPQAFAMRHGLATTRPLDMNQPATMAPELAKRQATAAAMRDRYATPLRVFTAAEAQQLSQVLAAFPTEGKIAYLDQMRRGLSDPQTFRAAMAQIAPDSPVTAVAATILTATDSVVMPGGMFSDSTVLQPRKVAATMLEGEAILNPTRGAKAQDGRGGKFPMPKEADLELAFTQVVGKAFRNDAAGFGTAYQAFKAYYAGAASQRGVLSEQIDNKLAKEAIAAATGGVIDFNGAGEVLKPWGTSDDQFKNEIAAEFNRLIEAAGYKGTSLDNLRAYGLLGLGQGRYAVVNGSDALRAPTGQAIILTLQARSTAQIPGAR